MQSLARLAGLLMACTTALCESTITEIYSFSDESDIENSRLRPNGHLIFSSSSNGSVWTLDPEAADPEPQLVAQLPGADAALGITHLGLDRYAVIGGVTADSGYDNETIYTVDLGSGGDVAVAVAATLPDAESLNGLDALPEYPHVVIASDSVLGALWRVDTDSGAVEQLIQDDALTPTANATIAIGANGLKVFGGYAYFTNSARATFGRIPLNESGYPLGGIELLTNLTDSESSGGMLDDFVFDVNGYVYVAKEANYVAKITPPEWQFSILMNTSTLSGVTSLSLAGNGSTVYATTRMGKIVEAEFPYALWA